VLQGDGCFLDGNLEELTIAPSTDSGLGYWYPSWAHDLLHSFCDDGDRDCSLWPLEPSLLGGDGVANDIGKTTSAQHHHADLGGADSHNDPAQRLEVLIALL
jgi:hypothetical protein